ncbi:hypothetical protein OG896_24840 [Streptomyces sp. NBC_00669]|uniref:hypothetical protein n=1 Tax=Streptomyces sp. NBC_00669 TaxID=2976011 RepID=UPI002E36EC7E|nr:hypothetical protein [Streptomyces sp. NBC_00669]
MTATATAITPPAEAPLYRRAETRLAVIGKGKRIHYSANDHSLCGKAITRYTDTEEAVGLDYEHCGGCIRVAEERANSISLAGASQLMAALHDVVDTVEIVDAGRATAEAPAEDDPAKATEDGAPAADGDPAEWCGTHSRFNFLHRFTDDLHAVCNRRIRSLDCARKNGVLVGHESLRTRADIAGSEHADLYTFCPRCLAKAGSSAPAADAEPAEAPAIDTIPTATAEDAPGPEVDAPEAPAEDADDDTQENTDTLPATIRPGDLVEGVVASSHPRTIRVRVDREPWKINSRCTVLCDGRGIDAVYTHTLRLAADDAEVDGATPADVPVALAALSRIASTQTPATPATPADEPPTDTPAEAADDRQPECDSTPAPADQGTEPQPQDAAEDDDAPAFPADLIRLSINRRSGTFHLGAMTEHGPAIICGGYRSPSLAPIGDDTAHSMCPTCDRSLALYLLASSDLEPERRLSEGTKSSAIAHYVFPDEGQTYCGKAAGDSTPGKKARVCSKCDGHRAGLIAFRAATGDADAA